MPLLQVGLPIAISFFTFMALSYVIDIYRRQLEPARPLDLALYLSFFPHLLAGPIVRGHELLPQLRRRRDASAIDYSRAFWLIMAGLFKKVVISSYVSSAIVTPVFTAPTQHSALEAIFAAWGYAVQIYCDFSGYTDIAIGLALLLGIRFPVNFDAPVHGAHPAGLLAALAHHPVALAARLPLHPAGRQHRLASARRVRNIMITMVLGGLWHGAAWTFVVWGALHGAGQGVGHLRRRSRLRPRPARSGRGPGAGLGPALRDLPVRLHRLGLLQRQRDRQRLLGPGPDGRRLGPAVRPGHAPAGAGGVGHPGQPVRAHRCRWPRCRRRSLASAPSSRSGCWRCALLVITTFGPAGVAPFIYYRF